MRTEQKSNDHFAEFECNKSVRHDFAFEICTQFEKTKNFAINNELNKQLHAEQINDVDHQSKNDRIFYDVHRDIAEISHFIVVIFLLQCRLVKNVRSSRYQHELARVRRRREHTDLRQKHEEKLQNIEASSSSLRKVNASTRVRVCFD